ncbi:hypothetical protein [Actinoplanes sp. CA-252034]|uniref:hypothetical protein n=1 Tax=Actinoplanes sp. CA-252034 TaxID=3239906 RepID=UPI003D9526C3
MRSTLSLSVERLRVITRIDGVDVSRADGNAGVDPWHVLVPVNRFVATAEPSSTLIACCPGCGPDCDAVEARIHREGDTVLPRSGPCSPRRPRDGRRSGTASDRSGRPHRRTPVPPGAAWTWPESAVTTDVTIPPGLSLLVTDRVPPDRDSTTSDIIEAWTTF